MCLRKFSNLHNGFITLTNAQGVLPAYALHADREAVRINYFSHPPLNPLPSREGIKREKFPSREGKERKEFPSKEGKEREILP